MLQPQPGTHRLSYSPLTLAFFGRKEASTLRPHRFPPVSDRHHPHTDRTRAARLAAVRGTPRRQCAGAGAGPDAGLADYEIKQLRWQPDYDVDPARGRHFPCGSRHGGERFAGCALAGRRHRHRLSLGAGVALDRTASRRASSTSGSAGRAPTSSHTTSSSPRRNMACRPRRTCASCPCRWSRPMMARWRRRSRAGGRSSSGLPAPCDRRPARRPDPAHGVRRHGRAQPRARPAGLRRAHGRLAAHHHQPALARRPESDPRARASPRRISCSSSRRAATIPISPCSRSAMRRSSPATAPP